MVNTRPRILVVTRNFPPLVGGMEKLIYHTYSELSKEYDMLLLGPEGCEEFASDSLYVRGCPLTPLPRFLLCLQWHAYRIAQRFRPQIILGGSGLAAPAVVFAARCAGAVPACYLHGLDLVAPNLIYRSVFVRAIRRCKILFANSRNTAELAHKAGVPAESVHVLHPGVTIPHHDRTSARALFRAKLNAANRPILLSVGRLSPRKGIVEFVTKSLPALVARHPDLLLVIIGSEPANALMRSHAETQRLMAAARHAGVENYIVMLGTVDDKTLSQAYSGADLLVFPALDVPGDVEGFGMVAIEAAAHGLPTVAFSVGGVADAVRPGISGHLVVPSNYAGLTAAIGDHLENEDPAKWRAQCVEFAAEFSWDIFGEKLRAILGNHASRTIN